MTTIIGSSFLFSLYNIFIQEIDNAETVNILKEHSLELVFTLCLSPIIEELIFRRTLPSTLGKELPKLLSIVVSNMLFSMAHFHVFFLPFFMNGMLYSLCYHKTKDIKISIAAHITYNLVAITC